MQSTCSGKKMERSPARQLPAGDCSVRTVTNCPLARMWLHFTWNDSSRKQTGIRSFSGVVRYPELKQKQLTLFRTPLVLSKLPVRSRSSFSGGWDRQLPVTVPMKRKNTVDRTARIYGWKVPAELLRFVLPGIRFMVWKAP